MSRVPPPPEVLEQLDLPASGEDGEPAVPAAVAYEQPHDPPAREPAPNTTTPVLSSTSGSLGCSDHT